MKAYKSFFQVVPLVVFLVSFCISSDANSQTWSYEVAFDEASGSFPFPSMDQILQVGAGTSGTFQYDFLTNMGAGPSGSSVYSSGPDGIVDMEVVATVVDGSGGEWDQIDADWDDTSSGSFRSDYNIRNVSNGCNSMMGSYAYVKFEFTFVNGLETSVSADRFSTRHTSTNGSSEAYEWTQIFVNGVPAGLESNIQNYGPADYNDLSGSSNFDAAGNWLNAPVQNSTSDPIGGNPFPNNMTISEFLGGMNGSGFNAPGWYSADGFNTIIYDAAEHSGSLNPQAGNDPDGVSSGDIGGSSGALSNLSGLTGNFGLMDSDLITSVTYIFGLTDVAFDTDGDGCTQTNTLPAAGVTEFNLGFTACPDLTGLTDGMLDIGVTESTCSVPNGIPIGGGITAPTTACPSGSTLMYSSDGGMTWSEDLPVYDQTIAITVDARCECDADDTMVSPTSSVTTTPGTCPDCPSLTATLTSENICGFEDPVDLVVTMSGGTAPFTIVHSHGTAVTTTTMANPATITVNPSIEATYTLTSVTDANGCTMEVSGTVNVFEEPTCTITPTAESACDTNDGQLAVTASDGTGPYTYSIDGGTSTVSNPITGLSPGSYTVLIKDANGCTTECMATVEEFVCTPAITIDKDDTDNDDDTQEVFDGTAEFTIEVCNTGDENLCSIVLSEQATDDDVVLTDCVPSAAEIDALILAVGDEDAEFDPGECFSFTCSVTGVTADFTNTITVNAAGCGTGQGVMDDDPSDVTVCPDLSGIAIGDLNTGFADSSCDTFGEDLTGGETATPATSCPTGSSLEYSLDGGATWSGTLPTYNQTTSITIDTRCTCDADETVSSAVSSVTTNPGACPICPDLIGIEVGDLDIAVTESTCDTPLGTLAGGETVAPTGTCPTGSTLQYSTDGTTWGATLPDYDQTTAITVMTRCACDADDTMASTVSSVTTIPGECPPDFDLALIKKFTTTGAVRPGDVVTFDVTVFNQGSVEAFDVDVADYFPACLTTPMAAYTSHTGVGTAPMVSDLGGGAYTISTIPAGEEVVVTLTFTIDAACTDTQITNNAEITGGATAPGGENARDSDSTPGDNVDSPADANDNDTDDEDGGDDFDPATFTICNTGCGGFPWDGNE